MLPPLSEVSPIFFTRHFLLTIVLGTVLTCGINGLIDYFMNRDKGKWYLMDSATAPSVFIFALIMSLLTFAGSGEIHKRIKANKIEPVYRFALRNSFLKKFLFFPIGEPNWKCRLPLWIWWSVLVPGVGMYAIILIFCWMATGFRALESEDVRCTLAEYVIWTEAWKGTMVVFMTTVNYAAAHNDEQSELIPKEGDLLTPEQQEAALAANDGLYGGV